MRGYLGTWVNLLSGRLTVCISSHRYRYEWHRGALRLAVSGPKADRRLFGTEAGKADMFAFQQPVGSNLMKLHQHKNIPAFSHGTV
jgi:hypothetical protein